MNELLKGCLIYLPIFFHVTETESFLAMIRKYLRGEYQFKSIQIKVKSVLIQILKSKRSDAVAVLFGSDVSHEF